MEKIAFAMTAIILNIPSFPLMILMNALVIVALKPRPRLQSNYNILLACLAGTELLVGVTVVLKLTSLRLTRSSNNLAERSDSLEAH